MYCYNDSHYPQDTVSYEVYNLSPWPSLPFQVIATLPWQGTSHFLANLPLPVNILSQLFASQTTNYAVGDIIVNQKLSSIFNHPAGNDKNDWKIPVLINLVWTFPLLYIAAGNQWLLVIRENLNTNPYNKVCMISTVLLKLMNKIELFSSKLRRMSLKGQYHCSNSLTVIWWHWSFTHRMLLLWENKLLNQ